MRHINKKETHTPPQRLNDNQLEPKTCIPILFRVSKQGSYQPKGRQQKNMPQADDNPTHIHIYELRGKMGVMLSNAFKN